MFFNGRFIIGNDYVRMYVVELRYTGGGVRWSNPWSNLIVVLSAGSCVIRETTNPCCPWSWQRVYLSIKFQTKPQPKPLSDSYPALVH